MSEEAAAAIDADMESDKASGSKAQQRKVTDSGRMETNGYHHMNDSADGEKTFDASQVAEKVWGCLEFYDRLHHMHHEIAGEHTNGACT